MIRKYPLSTRNYKTRRKCKKIQFIETKHDYKTLEFEEKINLIRFKGFRNHLYHSIYEAEASYGLFSSFELLDGKAILVIKDIESLKSKSFEMCIKDLCINTTVDKLVTILERTKEYLYRNAYNIQNECLNISEMDLGSITEEDFYKAKIKYYLGIGYEAFIKNMNVESLDEFNLEFLKNTYEVLKNEFQK